MATTSEHLVQGVMSVLGDMTNSTLNDPNADLMASLETLAALEDRIIELERGSSALLSYQSLMDVPQEDYGSLQHVRRDFDRRKAAWTSLSDWVSISHDWLHAPVTELDAEKINAEVRTHVCMCLVASAHQCTTFHARTVP